MILSLTLLLFALIQLSFVDSTCLYIKTIYPKAKSGMYEIWLPSGNHRVFCDMLTNGGGYTFISREMVAKMEPNDIHYLFTKKQDVLLKILKLDGTQPYTILGSPYLDVQLNGYNQFTAPVNNGMKPYIHLGTLRAVDSKVGNIEGFYSNNKYIYFRNCDGNPNNHFIFFPNLNNKAPSSYHAQNLVYEQQGVAVDWRKTALLPVGNINIPQNFFMLTEMHYGGCGTYTSSDRWPKSSSPAKGVAIGVR
ncbi:uncharacterized protein LOC100201344 isoform X4 [Hydra vulgaris]|uniref:Uncharacterized protein LOC100201344 isoform X4 n=2 Tax=Hydra vulgaris TaxID=6087 RepID=A0ABM4B550_HYDVU